MELLKATKKNLTHLYRTVEQLKQDQYTKPLALLSGSSLGQHVRHILEFYECLLLAESNGVVNYDNRERKLQMEEDQNMVLETIADFIEKLGKADLKNFLILQATFSENIEEHSVDIETSFERELMYNLDHTIHHVAIIKIAIQHYYPEVNMEENFGVAPSTVKARKRKSAA